jgi:hypothetical protein
MPKITETFTDQFGELHKYHKTAMKDSWRRHGINLDDFDNLYKNYLQATDCAKCNKVFQKRSDRCCDHNHSTGYFRHFLCRACNSKYYMPTYKNNTSGYPNIVLHEINGDLYFRVTVNYDKQPIVKSFNIHKYEIEDAVAWRDAKRIELGID